MGRFKSALLLIFVVAVFGSNIFGQNNSEAFFNAIAKGDKEIVSRLLGEGVSANAKNNDGRTALVHAAVNNQLEIVKLLLDKDGYVNGLSVNNETPLVGAVVGGNLEIVKFLHQSGGDINAKDNDKISILYHAIIYSGDNKDGFAIVKYLIDNGADVNTKQQNNFTALMKAAVETQPEVVKLLLDEGAKVNEQAKNKTSALLEAVRSGYNYEKQTANPNTSKIIEIINLLLEADADMSLADEDKNTPLSLALDYSYVTDYKAVAKLLIEKSPKLDAEALTKAAKVENAEFVKMILARGVDVNAKTESDGSTALIEAVRYGVYEETVGLKPGAAETIKFLLDKGADPKAKDNAGNSALKLAKQHKNYELVFTLLELKYKTSFLTRLGFVGFRYNRIQAIAGPVIYLLAVILSFFAMRKPKQPKRELLHEDGGDGLPRLVPLKCNLCGASVPLTALKDECPNCHTPIKIPDDYKHTVELRAKAAEQLEAAEKTWKRVSAYSNPILIGFLFLLGIAWLIPSLIGFFSDYAYWRPVSFFVSVVLSTITFPIAFFAMGNFLYKSPESFPPLPKIGKEIGEAETISCQTCGADTVCQPNHLVAICNYCGTENFRAAIAKTARKQAAEEESGTAMSLYDSVVALQERKQLAYQTIAGVGTTLLLITIASLAIIAVAIVVVALILLYLYITFS